MAEKPDKIQKYEKASPLVRDEDGNIIVEQDKPIILTQMEEGFETQISKLIPKAGKLKITQQQKNIILAKADEEQIEIRPDGIIYIPWSEYATRMTNAFGLEWTTLPKGMPKQAPGEDAIMWGFYLIIQGTPCGFAIGEQKYHRTNREMTWGDACEGAKSNALMRLCKGIGMNLEMWKPSFVKKWKKKYAVSYIGKDKDGNDKKLWKKREEEEEKPKQKAEPEKTGKKEEKKKDAEKKADKEKPKVETNVAKTDDEKSEPEEDKEDLIERINKKLEAATFDKKDFRLFLSKLQEEKHTKGRKFVDLDDKGNPSFYAGKTADLKALLTYFDWAKSEYIKFKKRGA